MDYTRLNNLKPIMQNEIDKGYISGAAVRILHKGSIVYEDELGFMNKEEEKTVRKDTIYRMFSMSKPVTAVATMILYERGLLNLLDPVTNYLEGFKNQKVWTEDGLVAAKKEATIWDLLNMTSGLPYPDAGFKSGILMDKLFVEVEQELKAGKEVSTLEFANRMGQVPLEFHPGERWRYGVSADILGAVIEVITKKSFGEFLDEEIFKPLGMVDTSFYVPEDKLERFAEIYEYMDNTKELLPCKWNFLGLNDFKSKPAFESGGAGLVSTIDDYSKFASMLLNKGSLNGVRILGRKTVDYLRTPCLKGERASYKDWDSMVGYDYGNLMRVLTDPVTAGSNASKGEFGWDGWTGNYFFIDPTEELIFLYAIQKCNGSNPLLMRRYRSIIYSAIE